MATREQRLWQWKPTTALVISVVTLVILLSMAAISELIIGWPGFRQQPWILAGIVLVAFVPVILTFIDFVADRGGKVETRWGSLEFAANVAVQNPTQSFQLPDNIEKAAQLADTGSETLRAMLDAALEHDVVEIDLRAGDAWWVTRLLYVAAIAAEQARPSALVVLATEARRSRTFQGWSPPDDVRDAILRRHTAYRQAYETALSMPEALKNALGSQLQSVENPPNPTPEPLSLGRAKDIFDPILWRDTIERSAPAAEQVEALLTAVPDYVAVTDNGTYVGLQKTDNAARHLLLGLLRSQEGMSGVPDIPT